MSKIHVSWEEATQRRLPMVCATCGDDATEWVERRLSAVRPGFFAIVRTRTKALLPFCRRHRVASWNGWARVMAWSINDSGITLGQVSADFVDAVLEYRRRPRRARSAVAEAAADEAGVELVENVQEASPRPRRRGSESGRLLYAVLMPILIGVMVACCGGGFLLFNLLRSTSGPGAPGIRQPEPFGPPGRGPVRR